MSELSTFKQIIGYVDQLKRDVGQLVVLIERLMQERGYESLPSVGRQICWYLSHNYNSSNQWRLPHAARFFIPQGTTKTSSSVFYLILLETRSAFPFPTVICGRVRHELLTESEISSIKVFHTGRIKSLTYKRSQWGSFREERGWYVAEPTSSSSAIHELWGYILNLFDVDNAQKARDNIVTPLTEGENKLDLRQTLSLPYYAFPEMEGEDAPAR